MSSTKTAVITDQSRLSILCSRFCEWTDEGIKQGYEERFGEEITQYNDPREAICRIRNPDGVEWQFVAELDGQVGVLSEFETIYVEADDPSQFPGEKAMTSDDFQALVETYRERLFDADERFPKTQFFIGHGEVTFDGRLTLNGFTPFDKDDDGNIDVDSVTGDQLDWIYDHITKAL